MHRIDSTLSQKITSVNILLTLLIVWLHVSANYNVPSSVSDISIISVPCFFAISSFLYFISFDFDKPWMCYKLKVASRTKSLLIPFLIFNLFGLLFSIAAYKIHPVSQHPLSDVTLSNIFIYFYESKPNGPLWYLRSLYLFFLVAPLLGFIIRSTKYSIILSVPLYILCKNMSYFSFVYWMVDIYFGAYIAIYYADIRKLKIFKEPLFKWGG